MFILIWTKKMEKPKRENGNEQTLIEMAIDNRFETNSLNRKLHNIIVYHVKHFPSSNLLAACLCCYTFCVLIQSLSAVQSEC